MLGLSDMVEDTAGLIEHLGANPCRIVGYSLGAMIVQELLELPRRYAAVIHAMQYLSPQTLNDEQRIADWLDIFEMSGDDSAIDRAQRGLDQIGNRLMEYRKIRSQCLVIGFQDDLVIPPFFGREVAAVNAVLIDFFRQSGRTGAQPRPATVSG